MRGQAHTRSEPSSGCLVLVVGPSGAGKDTLIDGARVKFDNDSRFYFPRRFITRAADIDEDHQPVSAVEFEAMAQKGLFLLHWRAHGLSYGIPVEAGAALNAGANIVANVSRTIVGEALGRFPSVRVVRVSADERTLNARLAARGREDSRGVAARLARSAQIGMPEGCPCDEVRNDGKLEEAVRRFTDLLESYAANGMRV